MALAIFFTTPKTFPAHNFGAFTNVSCLLLEQGVKWVYELKGYFIARELKIGSDHTIVDWKKFASEVCRQDSERILVNQGSM
jgi:hypothetical protein